jgi:hypothetical protein
MKGWVIYNHHSYLSAFGGGSDIGIREGAHNRSDNFTDLGNSYELPAGMEYASE